MLKQTAFLLLLLAAASLSFAQNNYKEATLPQVMQKVQKGEKGYIILDVRTPGEYMDTVPGGRQIGIGRIRNAINVSLQDLLQKPEAIKQLEQYKNDEVYVICSHSYRSRRISNLLLEKGFTNVNNVRGGMSEWYRNYDELKPYMGLYENNIAYHNMAPAQLFTMLKAKEPVEIIAFMNPPRFYFDSLVAPLYLVFPDFKNVTYHRTADSLQILEKVKAAPGKTFVFASTIGGGSTDMAEWVARKGYKNMYSLNGNISGFFEYLVNYQPKVAWDYLVPQSKIKFFSPLSYCNNTPDNAQWVDLRHDTTFNKVTRGTKLDYKTLKGAVNFPFYKTADDFVKEFPDKSKLYMLIPQENYKGVELATALMDKGYRIGWLLSGIERWEWYANNIPEFRCGDWLIK
jgi:rhodanese-related sulfurtransferase